MPPRKKTSSARKSKGSSSLKKTHENNKGIGVDVTAKGIVDIDVSETLEALQARKEYIDQRFTALGISTVGKTTANTNINSISGAVPSTTHSHNKALASQESSTRRRSGNRSRTAATTSSAGSNKGTPSTLNENEHNQKNDNDNGHGNAEASTSTKKIPFVPRTDTHWDFLMKEMMWLGADFQGERKRQVSSAKKMASSVLQFHKTKEARRLRELHQAEMKRRKIAAKLGRDMKGWWTKIEKVIAYKQKLLADQERQMAMNKQLVVLVQQTEKYTESLSSMKEHDGQDYSDSDSNTSMSENSTIGKEFSDKDETTDATSDSGSDRGSTENSKRRRQRRRRHRHRHRMTIEEALASSENSLMIRSSKKKRIDYARMHRSTLNEDATTGITLYGESTASEDASGSDGSYDPENDSQMEDEEDEYSDSEIGHSNRMNSFEQAMQDELKERQEEQSSTFYADPEELRKLREEVHMDVQDVLSRLRKERTIAEEENADPALSRGSIDTSGQDDTLDSSHTTPGTRSKSKHVSFSESIQQRSIPPSNVMGEVAKDGISPTGNVELSSTVKYDADDDGDASDVEDYDDTESNRTSDEEFEVKDEDAEADDETTIAQEEALPKDMSTTDELTLLQQEGDLPIEQLRAMYASMANDNTRLDSSESRMDRKGSTREDDILATDRDAIDDDMEEYVLSDSMEVDDETTLDAEEKMGRDISHEEEMDVLKQDSEIPIEQLRAMYAAMPKNETESNVVRGTNASNEEIVSKSSSSLEESDDDKEEGMDEFEFIEHEAIDDETTMEAEEKLGRDMSYKDEIALLQEESEMSVEELRAKYAKIPDSNSKLMDLDESNIGKHGDLKVTRKTTNNLTEEQSSLFQTIEINSEKDPVDEEFTPTYNELDDETTLEAEEKLGRDISYNEELELLKRESEMSVEELRQLYTQPEKSHTDPLLMSQKKRKRNEEEEKAEIITKNQKTDDDNAPDDGLSALNSLEASAERAQQTLASRPFLLAPWVKLRHYQQIGLNWLVSLQSRRLNGILADEMGLGKTLQTISLLAYLASYKGIWGPHLIIVPTSVIINWETEFKRFCPAFKVLCYHGSAKRRKELRQGWTKTNWNHVIITSYQLAVQDAFAFKRKKWYYLVLDEAQNIKNFQSQRWQTLINFNTQRRLLLTGTPLQNNLMELWSLLHFLMPFVFRSRKEFSYWFSNPMSNMIEGNSNQNDDVIKRLHGIIRPFVLRRLKKDVEKQMPGKYEHVVKCKLSRRQMTLYEEFLSRSSTRNAMKKGGNFLGMMNVLMQLRKVCNHPDLFEPRSVITPFVMPSISMAVPSFLCCAISDMPSLHKVSAHLMQPVWCGSSGLPSIKAALSHGDQETAQLKNLCANIPKFSGDSNSKLTRSDCPDELKDLIQQIQAKRDENERHKNLFQNQLNTRRCNAFPFPFTERTLSSVKVEDSGLNLASPVELISRRIVLTPSALLSIRRTEQERANEMEGTIDKFAFCVPSAGAKYPELHAGNHSSPNSSSSKSLDKMLLEPIEELMRPYQRVQARLSSFFPDKKLVQFDAGKLQTLADLLHKLKRGGHRCLIFTQMSKMLDILEAFLNLNGHTYLRLDGATGVERRQRYMDRFNNDTKVFCFILSTRSGGTGINLTGADTVIFYDSDWNFAMDAQAQDRAHRIGQTRDVHIYRLITEHSIEENILMKAQQKKKLDKMVMDQGKFDALKHEEKNAAQNNVDSAKDTFTKDGLLEILGAEDNSSSDTKSQHAEIDETAEMTKDQMDKAMASLEDDDDVQALRGAQKETAEELEEFDENVEVKKDSDAENANENDSDAGKKGGRPKKRLKKTNAKTDSENKTEDKKTEESELEKEFASWQTSVGFDAAAIDSSLSPMERYGLTFRENIDPFYSVFYLNELRRKSEVTDSAQEIDIEEIERQKANEERQAIDDGDLLGTRPRPEDLIRHRHLYRREKARLRSDKKRGKITGQSWVQKIDGLSKRPFWYNETTGEAVWDTPSVLIDLQAEELASKQGWSHLQIHILIQALSFLPPYPDRQNCALVCKQWKQASTDASFVRHVYPVEMGALARDLSRRDHNHVGSIEEALEIALPGDTIELADGHYWIQKEGLHFDKPLKLIGDEHNAANVVVEMKGSVSWTGCGGFIEGVTFRRPKMNSTEDLDDPMLIINGEGRVDMVHSVLDNDGSSGSVVTVTGNGPKGIWSHVILRNGQHGLEISGESASLVLNNCTLRGNLEAGISCTNKADIKCHNGNIRDNRSYGIQLLSGASGTVTKSIFKQRNDDTNEGGGGGSVGPIQRESGCTLTASMNIAVMKKKGTTKRGIPGFRMLTAEQYDKEQEQKAHA